MKVSELLNKDKVILNLKVLYISNIMFMEPVSEEDEKILEEIDEHTNGRISSEALIDLKT